MMASVTREKNGCVRIWFKDADGNRKGIRIGKMNDKYAERFKDHVEELVTGSITNTRPNEDSARWVMGLPDAMQDKLAHAGLIEIQSTEPEAAAPALEAFMDSWIAGRCDVKESTRRVHERGKKWLIEFFGADRSVYSITAGDADDWAGFLRSKLAENTARKLAGVAKLAFRYAVRKELISTNPFADLVASVRENPERDHTVTHEEFDKVVEVLPDGEWRLIVALARLGGLRVPSEIFALKWRHVNLSAARFTIPSPKTERHVGGASRLCPIFPELKPFFTDALQAVSNGTRRVQPDRYVIELHRTNSGNLSTQLRRFIAKVGLKEWPRIWHNMRASRQTKM